MAISRYDLHVHSTASDGVLAPREVVALAAQRGLAGIALTDHDTIAGLPQAQAMAAALGLLCLSGVELSCTSAAGRHLHLLGYLFAADDPRLREMFNAMRDERIERATSMVERIREFHPELTIDHVLRQSGDAPPGRPHIARAMVALGIIREFDAAFTTNWLAPGGRAWVARAGLDVADAIDALHEAGGIAVLAHPAARMQQHERDALIREAAALGLDGVEADHPAHDGEAVEQLANLADELQLLQTAGSDDHGTDLDGPRLGCRTVVQRTIDQMQRRAERYR